MEAPHATRIKIAISARKSSVRASPRVSCENRFMGAKPFRALPQAATAATLKIARLKWTAEYSTKAACWRLNPLRLPIARVKTACSRRSIWAKPSHGPAGLHGACRSRCSSGRKNSWRALRRSRSAQPPTIAPSLPPSSAALPGTGGAMSSTPTDALAASAGSAELADRLTITQQGQGFRLDIIGDRGGGTSGVVLRAELQRILRMLEGEVIKAAWVAVVAPP